MASASGQRSTVMETMTARITPMKTIAVSDV